MKARDLKALGFEPVVLKEKGRMAFMLPLAVLSDAGAEACGPEQLLEIMRLNVDDAKKSIAKLEKKLSGSTAAPGA